MFSLASSNALYRAMKKTYFEMKRRSLNSLSKLLTYLRSGSVRVSEPKTTSK